VETKKKKTRKPQSIYEGRLFVCFVLFVPMRSIQLGDASDLGLFGKLLRRRGAVAWFHGIWTCCAKISEELECAFGVLGKILISRI
jgi:hypothetical protein